jgi:DNA repair protein SbcD/Mre11
MRIAHLADLHLGFRQYPRTHATGLNQREVDVLRAFRAAVDLVIAERPDVVLIAGDVFHQVRPPNPAILHAARHFARLVEGLPGVPIIVIAGNHDLPRATETGCILRLFASAQVTVVDAAEQRLRLGDGALSVLAVPDQLGNALPRLDIDREAQWNVLLLHGEVQGVLPSDAAILDRNPSEVALEELTRQAWDYVALGHYHVHREVAPRAWYAGSLEYVSSNIWGELADQRDQGVPGKGFVMHDLATGEHRFVPVPSERRVLDLPPFSADGLGPAEVDARIAATVASVPGGITDAVARLVITNIPRSVTRELDHKAMREYKRLALHFQLDPRKPVAVAPGRSGSGAAFSRPSLTDIVRTRLDTRPLPAEITREQYVTTGLSYLESARESILTDAADATEASP